MNLKNNSLATLVGLGLLVVVSTLLIGAAATENNPDNVYQAVPLSNSSFVVLNQESGSGRVFTVSPDGKIISGSTEFSGK